MKLEILKDTYNIYKREDFPLIARGEKVCLRINL